MPGRFILSLDCEGKWGAADSLTTAHRRELTDDKLRVAYQTVLSLLDEYQIKATFAFAGAFSQSAVDFGRVRPEIERLSRIAPDYLLPALRDLDETNGTGWHGRHLVDAVTDSRTAHEVALHGVTHVPWTRMDDDFAEAEMHLFKSLEGPVRNSRTFVYPRNLVAHANILAAHGFAGFRTARSNRSRFSSLLSEFNTLEAPEQPARGNGITPIPAGFFLNWRSGLRRLVPPAVTLLRARKLLDSASLTGGVVHYWLHPENVATAPDTMELLRSVIREVAIRRDAGHCEVLTQLGYCRWVESLP